MPPPDAPLSPLRILIIAPGGVLAPRTGAELRTFHLAERLARRGHAVDLIGFVLGNHPRGRRREGALTLEQRHSRALDLATVADRLRLIPITELPVYFRALRGWLTRRAAGARYDVVQFEFPWWAVLYDAVAPGRDGRDGPAGAGPAIVYDAHNIESSYWAPHLARFAGARRFAARLARAESAAVAGASAVAACTEADRAELIARLGADPARTIVAPNGFDERRWRLADPETRRRLRAERGWAEGERIALLVGSGSPPNREAAREALARLAGALSEANAAGRRTRLVVVGRAGEALPRPLPPGIEAPGVVEDSLPWMQAADLGLNPVASGSGSNIKLAEYAAAGLGIVTSEFGLRGYEPLRPWVRVAEPAALAEAVLAPEPPAAVPSDAAAQFSWDASAAQLERLYRSSIDANSS